MAGGLLNIKSYGNSNIIIYGNPQKTFFKAKYKQLTNFGIQRFRIDQEGTRFLRFNEETTLEFKIPRYADMLYETFFVVDLPDIWSPAYYNQDADEWVDYGFRWIEEIGSTMINEIEIYSGTHTLAKYSGEYISCMAHRDLPKNKLDLWNNSTGNVHELFDPEYAHQRYNVYPTAFYHGSTNIRPSILGRKLYIPLEAWFSKSPGCALPLVAMQYTELYIRIRIKPIKNLYSVRDVNNTIKRYPYKSPNPNVVQDQIHRFLSPPEDQFGNVTVGPNYWNADPHIIGTYIFLDDDERKLFAKETYSLLIRDIIEHDFPNTTGSKTIKLETKGLVSNYMFRFRRSDVVERNEWANYTNWYYHKIPYNVVNVNTPDGLYATPSQYIFTTGNYNANEETAIREEILQSMGILMDGKYRENELDSGIFSYVEKYNRTKGTNKRGLYLYSFALDTNSYNYQPSGGMNMDKFNNIHFELQTLEPPLDPSGSYLDLCDEDGNIIGTRKNTFDMNMWNYDLRFFEERYNMVIIKGGMIGLMFAR
jgi:hypothetical protein